MIACMANSSKANYPCFITVHLILLETATKRGLKLVVFSLISIYRAVLQLELSNDASVSAVVGFLWHQFP